MNSLCHRMDLAARYHEAKGEYHTSTIIRSQLDILQKISEGEPYLAASFYVPSELLNMFKVHVLYLERTAGFAAAVNLISSPISRGMLHGFSECSCSYQMMFDHLLKSGLLPPPVGFVASTFACDDAWMYSKATAAKLSIPFDLIDTLEENSEAAAGFLSNQLEAVYDKLQQRYEAKETLAHIVELSNRAARIKRWIDSKRAEYPGIISSMDIFKVFTLLNDLGSTTAIEILEKLKERIEGDIHDYVSNSKPRLLWLGIVPLYKNSFVLDIERKYNCTVVYEELFHYARQYLSKDSFFKDLASRMMSSIFFSVENRADFVFECAQNMNIDGIIHYSHRSCRLLPAMVPMLREKLRKTGIPLVEIQGDAVDSAYFNELRMYQQLDTLFEMIEQRC